MSRKLLNVLSTYWIRRNNKNNKKSNVINIITNHFDDQRLHINNIIYYYVKQSIGIDEN